MAGTPVLTSEQIDYLPITYKKEKLKFFMMLIGGALQPEDTNYLYIVDENNYATLILYKGNNTVIKVPTIIDGYTVKYIAPTCFNYNTNITSITIPEGIETIE